MKNYKKIAVTASGNTMESSFCHQFGRAPYIIVYDVETASFQVMDNDKNLNAPMGAGIQTAQDILDKNVDALVTGHCGPKAQKVLGNLKIYETTALTVKEALLNFEMTQQ